MIVELGIAAVVLLGLKAKSAAPAAEPATMAPASVPLPVTPKPPDVRPMPGLRYAVRTPENSAPFWVLAPGAPIITYPPLGSTVGGIMATIPVPGTGTSGGSSGSGSGGSGGGGVIGGGGGRPK